MVFITLTSNKGFKTSKINDDFLHIFFLLSIVENERKKTFFHKKRMIVVLAVGVVFFMISMISASWLIMKKRKGIEKFVVMK